MGESGRLHLVLQLRPKFDGSSETFAEREKVRYYPHGNRSEQDGAIPVEIFVDEQDGIKSLRIRSIRR